MATPQHQNGNRYHVQFHGTGLVFVKHLVNESSMMADTQSLTASLTSSSSSSFADDDDTESVACDPAFRLSCSCSRVCSIASSISLARSSRSWALSRTSEKRRAVSEVLAGLMACLVTMWKAPENARTLAERRLLLEVDPRRVGSRKEI